MKTVPQISIGITHLLLNISFKTSDTFIVSPFQPIFDLSNLHSHGGHGCFGGHGGFGGLEGLQHGQCGRHGRLHLLSSLP